MYIDVYRLATNGEFKGRCTVALTKACQIVLGEANNTTNHAARLSWAKETLIDPEAMANKTIWTIVHDSTIQTKGTGASDAEIQTAVNSNIDNFAK